MHLLIKNNDILSSCGRKVLKKKQSKVLKGSVAEAGPRFIWEKFSRNATKQFPGCQDDLSVDSESLHVPGLFIHKCLQCFFKP